jgi:hypothetical protein
MIESQGLDAAKVEQLKKELVIDETVAEKYNRPIPVIEKGLDPRLVDLILKWCRKGKS